MSCLNREQGKEVQEQNPNFFFLVATFSCSSKQAFKNAKCNQGSKENIQNKIWPKNESSLKKR